MPKEHNRKAKCSRVDSNHHLCASQLITMTYGCRAHDPHPFKKMVLTHKPALTFSHTGNSDTGIECCVWGVAKGSYQGPGYSKAY